MKGEEFGKDRSRKDGLQSWCKKCKREYYKNNSDKILEKKKEYYNNNKDKIKEYRENNRDKIKEYRENNRDKINEYRENNRDKIAEQHKEYYNNNRDKINEYMRKQYRNPFNKLNKNVSSSIRRSLKGNKNGQHWETLVGYTAQELMDHLESLFWPGMSWENMGDWHIDHIKPISSFSFTSPEEEEFLECWRLGNLQPLWGSDNISKGNIVIYIWDEPE